MKKIVAAFFACGLAAVSQAAFRAADQGVVLAVGRTPGARGGQFVTDLLVLNAAPAPVRLDLVFLPTGGGDNSKALSRVVTLGPIAVGATLVVPDVLLTTFGIPVGYGAMLYFGSLADAPAVVAPVIVQARVHSAGAGGTSGTLEPGLPYYDEANPSASDVGADTHVLAGLEEDDAFRTNVGVWNGSDPSTSVVLAFEVFDREGRPAASLTVSLPPLAHRQLNGFLSQQGLTGAGYTVAVHLASSTSPDPGTRPYFFAYAAVTDNRTNDPSFVEPAYRGQEPVACFFP
jgi:hypothetical protein